MEKLSSFGADGAYDQRKCYEAVGKYHALATISPRKDARIQQHGNCKAPRQDRDENLRCIRQQGRGGSVKVATIAAP